LLYSDVGHGRGGGRAVPVFFAGSKPDHIPRMNLLDRAGPALRAPAAGGHNQRLTERVRVPRRARAGFESDARATHARGVSPIEQWIDANRAGEPVGRSLAGRLRSASFDVHGRLLDRAEVQMSVRITLSHSGK